ncbi:membrane protein [Candidatus Magnetomorum sp. HK-1]|nr:membrane protein [Candidatus Magnetomorum sp. HK-1]
MKEIINKIQGDFFSILIPGFYLLVAVITISISLSSDHLNLVFCSWNEFKKFCYNWNNYWPLYFFLFFVSYLFGHILRAFPVKNADKLCKRIFFWTTTENSLDRIYYTTNFPYYKALSRVLSNLQNNLISKDVFSLPDKKNLHSAFNFFKATCYQLA